MAKLAEGTGMKIPEQARNALNVRGVNMEMPKAKVNIAPPREQEAMPPIATECFMLSNMFDPATEREQARNLPSGFGCWLSTDVVRCEV